MFADDTAILASHTEPKLVARAINRHLLVLEDWFSKWKIALNVAKTEAVFFTRKTRLTYPDIFLHNEKIPWFQNTKYLGVTLDNKLTFKQHITRILKHHETQLPIGEPHCPVRTLEASDPVHGDGTITGTEVTTLSQRPTRKFPLATRERAIILKSHTQRKHEKLPPHWTGDQPS
ncbi:uncharacterized protein TNCV_1662281 [Trichonephila clavipes]|nr:uncharacterized protein TNCV_1662281 [Trichonephila clavipes]